jgi:hypothetical protein
LLQLLLAVRASVAGEGEAPIRQTVANHEALQPDLIVVSFPYSPNKNPVAPGAQRGCRRSFLLI